MDLRVDCFLCRNTSLLGDPDQLRQCMFDIAEVGGMHCFGDPQIVDYPFPLQSDPSKPALSAVLFLGESSLVVHTYPEKDTVFMNVFHCLPFDVDTVFAWIVDKFQMDYEYIDADVLNRGLNPITGHPRWATKTEWDKKRVLRRIESIIS